MSRNQTLQEALDIWNECLESEREKKEQGIKELAEKYFHISFKEEKNFDRQTIIKLTKIPPCYSCNIVGFLEGLSVSKFQELYSQFSDLEKYLVKEKMSKVSRARFNLDYVG